MLIKKIAFFVTGILFSVLWMTGCDRSESQKKSSAQAAIITVQSQASVTHLYYNGVLLPLETTSVLSSVAGQVVKMHFQYGEIVKDQQLLFEISSSKLTDDFHTAVTQYLQNKSQFENEQQNFAATKALTEAGVTSEQDYQMERNSYETSLLTFYQSKYQLEKILKQAGMNLSQIEAMSIADMNSVNDIFKKQFSDIKVVAAANGVALFPTGSSGNSGDDDDSDQGGSSGDDAPLRVGSEH